MHWYYVLYESVPFYGSLEVLHWVKVNCGNLGFLGLVPNLMESHQAAQIWWTSLMLDGCLAKPKVP